MREGKCFLRVMNRFTHQLNLLIMIKLTACIKKTMNILPKSAFSLLVQYFQS